MDCCVPVTLALKMDPAHSDLVPSGLLLPLFLHLQVYYCTDNSHFGSQNYSSSIINTNLMIIAWVKKPEKKNKINPKELEYRKQQRNNHKLVNEKQMNERGIDTGNYRVKLLLIVQNIFLPHLLPLLTDMRIPLQII